MKKDRWWENIKGRFFVWSWSKRWNRFINTHVYENQRDAELTVKIWKKK